VLLDDCASAWAGGLMQVHLPALLSICKSAIQGPILSAVGKEQWKCSITAAKACRFPKAARDEQHWQAASDPLDDVSYQLMVVSHNSTCAVRLDDRLSGNGLQIFARISIGSD